MSESEEVEETPQRTITIDTRARNRNIVFVAISVLPDAQTFHIGQAVTAIEGENHYQAVIEEINDVTGLVHIRLHRIIRKGLRPVRNEKLKQELIKARDELKIELEEYSKKSEAERYTNPLRKRPRL